MFRVYLQSLRRATWHLVKIGGRCNIAPLWI